MEKIRKRRAAAGAGLLFAAFIWGFAFVVVKNSVDVIPPVYMLAIRFSIAAVGLAVIFFRKFRLMTKALFIEGCVLGAWLFISYYLQTEALKYTTAGNNAFLTTIYVVIVPFLHWMLNKKRPDKYCVGAAFLAIAGIGFLSLNGSFTMNLGDILTILCGFGYAIHMIYIDRYTQKHDPILLTILQLAAVSVFSWILAPFVEGGFPAGVFRSDMVTGMLYLGLLSSMVGFLLQNVGQKYTEPSTASLFLSMESVFGALFGVLVLGEKMTGKMLFGCMLMLTAIIMAETKFSFKGERKRKEKEEKECLKDFSPTNG